jgi:predicted NAD-dependent protein-ADP-ribosyltransferase YbiA (DUF1768 family)
MRKRVQHVKHTGHESGSTGCKHYRVQQCYQLIKAICSGDITSAEKIRNAKTALDAKKIGKTMRDLYKESCNVIAFHGKDDKSLWGKGIWREPCVCRARIPANESYPLWRHY